MSKQRLEYKVHRTGRMVQVGGAPEPWDDDRLVGRLIAEAVRGRRYVYVWQVDVLPAYQRQGIATQMARELHKAMADRIVLHEMIVTREGLAWARSLPKRWNRVTDPWPD